MMSLQSVQAGVKDEETAKPLQLTGGEIRFEDVHFAFKDRMILSGASFTIPAKKTVAIVGASGSGKSTLLRLLYRFYDPQQGKITIDGQDLRHVTLDSVRQSIGVVPQDTILFNDSIFYNIHYGRPSATREEVIEAAKLARIHDTIMSMPEGYESVVGERGLKLSGGEKQRVSIARMILKNPSIVFCDEATSALDSHTEAELLNNLRELSGDKTTIFVAHRLATVVESDWILVLEKGKVVESGTHQSLLEEPGSRYAQMWWLQATTKGETDDHIKEKEKIKEKNSTDLETDNSSSTASSASVLAAPPELPPPKI